MINILVIENNSSILVGYKQIIKDFFITTVNCDFADNLTDGLIKIKNLDANYAGAVVDLRLDATETDGEGGNTLIREIKRNLRFPIFVLSGHIDDLETDLKPNEPSLLFQCLDKGSPEGEFKTVIEEIIKINTDLTSTGIFNILSRKGQIEQHISDIFYTHISKSLNYWKSNPSEKALLRYTLSHLQEYLELGEQGDLEPYHPVEFFINPPIKEHKKTVFTGDVLKEISSGIFHIILTPACDITIQKGKSEPKAKFITIAQINDFNIDASLNSDEKKKVKNNTNQMYHFLPTDINNPITYTGGSAINFCQLKSIPIEHILDATKYQKVFAISGSFKKDIIARFAHYYARQGQPGIL